MMKVNGSRRTRAQQGGFTLIEIVIAVGILAILIAMAWPKEDPDKAKAVAMIQAMDTIGQGAVRLRIDAGCYPLRPDALYVKASAATSSCGLDLQPQWRGPYMSTGTTDATGNIMGPNIASTMTYGLSSAAGGAGTQYFVHAANVPNTVIKRALEQCNGSQTATAPVKCTATQGGTGTGTLDYLYDEST
jgi:prepilin-type N-terminal cleavage/methylation domain-containing protein